MKKILPGLIITLLFSITPLLGQDTLYLNNGNKIVGWVTETTPKKVKFTLDSSENSPFVKIPMTDVKGIKFKDGQVIGKRYFRKYKSKDRNDSSAYNDKPYGIFGLYTFSPFTNYKGYGGQVEYGVTSHFLAVANLKYFDLDQIGDKIAFDVGFRIIIIPNKKFPVKPFLGASVGIMEGDLIMGFPLGLRYSHKSGFSTQIAFPINHWFKTEETSYIYRWTSAYRYRAHYEYREEFIGVLQVALGYRF